MWRIFSASTMLFDQNVVVGDEKNKSKQSFLLRIFTGPGGEGTLQIIGWGLYSWETETFTVYLTMMSLILQSILA